MFKKLRTVIYHVSDLEKAKEWYKKVMGKAPYFDESFYVGFNIDGSELGLDSDLAHTNEGEHSVAYWQVDDIKDASNNLIANGEQIIEAIHEVGDEGISVAIAEDPFGNYVGLIEE